MSDRHLMESHQTWKGDLGHLVETSPSSLQSAETQTASRAAASSFCTFALVNSVCLALKCGDPGCEVASMLLPTFLAQGS